MNKELFKSKVVLKGTSQNKLAEQLGISPCAFSSKVRGKTEFTCREIMQLEKVLELSQQETRDIFFEQKVV